MGDLWDEVSSRLDEDVEYGTGHAALRYEDLENSGPPVRPLEFPVPNVDDCEWVNLIALDHRTGLVHEVQNVLIGTDNGEGKASALPSRAYLLKKKISKSVYGNVRLCVVLQRRNLDRQEDFKDGQAKNESVLWESTEELVVLKSSSWAKIRQLRGRHLEDPIREIKAMQHIGNYHPHVVGCLDVFQDESWLYVIERYCHGGDLYGNILSEGCHQYITNESKVRRWFKQLLLGLYHLQRKGVCHRDICLENVMLDKNNNLVIIDFGLSLRVPYDDARNVGCITDVSEGTCRRLMKAQGQGGNRIYMSPEVAAGNEAFDGYAIDLWGAGIILFILLVGLAPFDWASFTDKRYEKICRRGHLKDLIRRMKLSLSPEACDLLQNMMWHDPRDRLSLADVMRHPWVIMDESNNEAENERTRSAHKGDWATSLNSTMQVF